MSIKYKRANILQTLTFLINPFLSLLMSIYYSFKNKYSVNIWILSLSVALIFIYFPLLYDTSSNYYATFYAAYHQTELQDIRLYNAIALYLNTFFGIQFITSVFLFTTFILFVWFSIFKYYKNLTNSNKMIVYMGVFAFSSIIFRNIMDLNRFYFANSLLLFFIFIIETKKKENLTLTNIFILLIFGFLSYLIHPSSLLLLFVYIVAINTRSIKLFVLLPLVSLSFGYFSNQLLLTLLDLPVISSLTFVELLRGYVDISNKWGANFKIQGYVLLSRIIDGFLMFLIYYKGISLLKLNINDTLVKTTLLLMGVVLFILSYYSLYERYSIVFFLFSSFIVYKSILLKKRNDLLLNLIIFGFIIRFVFINFVWYGVVFTDAYRDVLPNQQKKIEMAFKPFYYPTLILLNVENVGYSDLYIQQESLRGREYIFDYVKNPVINNND